MHMSPRVECKGRRCQSKVLVLTPVTIVVELAIGSEIARSLPVRDTRRIAIFLVKEIPLGGQDQFHLVEGNGLELSRCGQTRIGPQCG